MKIDRRAFIKNAMGTFTLGLSRQLGFGKLFAPAAAPAAPVVATAAAATGVALHGPYGAGVRQQVFEVIVRQGVAGAPWKEICRGPMTVNKISEEQVEAEITRRLSAPCYGHAHCRCPKCERKRFELYSAYLKSQKEGETSSDA